MKYAVGTVTMINGSPNVVGAGTKWSANVAAGQLLTIAGSGVSYEIGAVVDDTHLTLASNWVYPGTGPLTALQYTIIQSFTANFNFPYPDIGDVQTATILKRAINMIDSVIADNVAPSITVGYPTAGIITGHTGQIFMQGATSGRITIQSQAAAGTYNFNLPTTAGASGAPLLSGGGGSGVMSWGSVSGSGAFLLAASPTTTGTLTAAAINASGTITAAAINASGTVTANALTATTQAQAATLAVNGSSSGKITIQPQAAAGTFNFNLPITAGASGAPLVSGGGGATAMTWGSVTGTGTTFVLSIGPTFTGTTIAATITASGTIQAAALQVTGTTIAAAITASGTIQAAALQVTGTSSGVITIDGVAAAGTYNFNLPTTAGTSGAPLLSGGGGSSAMTWGTVSGTGAFALVASPTFTGTLNAAAITATGALQAATLAVTGSSSGVITIDGQAAAGTYNFNLPITAGSAGQVLISGGGGSNPMTWGTVSGTGSFAMTNAPTFTGGATFGGLTISTQTSGAAYSNQFINSAAVNAYGVEIVFSGTATPSGGYFAVMADNGGNRCLIAGSGNITNVNNAYGAISDAKFKTNVERASSQWNDIKAISSIVSKFDLVSSPDEPKQIGLVAQELQKISPGLVFETIETKRVVDDNGSVVMEPTGEISLGVKYSILYMKAVKALGEALERIDFMTTQIAANESRFAAIEAKLGLQQGATST